MIQKRKRFASYYNTYFDKIYRYIYFRVGRDREMAEDLTSEVMLKAYEGFEDFDQDRSFGVWIYRIAHNHLVDHYKKVKKEIVPLEDAESKLKVNERIEEKADASMNLEHVGTVLEQLPDQQRNIIVMKYFNDLTHKEIARILDMTEAHVRVLAHRALGVLRQRLSFLNS